MSEGPEYTTGSGNVFRDLGFPDADELLVKAELALEISRIIEHRDLTQAQAAELLGVDQPKVSALVRGRLDGFSLERLYRFLNSLGLDIQITLLDKPTFRKKAGVRVVRETREGYANKREIDDSKGSTE